jgi:hypothetical protein
MKSRRALHHNLGLAATVSFLLGASSVHCGGGQATTSGSFASGTGANSGAGGSGVGTGSASGGATGVTGSGSGGDIGIDVYTPDYSADQIYASDPPPTTCDGGGMPPPVMGTPECPSDKNLPGCPCTTLGQTAACWTGLRKDRDHGDCKDDTTKCVLEGETDLVWGPCNGEVLPVAGATGKAACGCFSTGHWAVANLSPCFYSSTDGMGNTTQGAISTLGSTMMCPSSFTSAPTESWSTDTLSADCTGSFNLCYTIKAGDGKNPQASDCVIAQVCSQSYYSVANVIQMWPDLPGWLSPASAASCVQQFETSGGYGQMSVDGQSDQCELVDEVFQTVTYCPLSCNMPNPPAMCSTCMAGGGGSF